MFSDNKNIVDCSVNNCKYHGLGDCCKAESIQVGTEYAIDQTETFCSTFKKKN